ncbi:UDP-N-acetylmuramate dehydrogenase [Gracilibacillus sp. HCP3S3_G5_1]|uniref:UDP-N-acetylmuramate dehydrogenase n=1 Tax=unclassified Gracilibacillus TaxID=2625209 RepID=UPI003F8AE436
MNYVSIKNCSLKQYNTLKLESVASEMVLPININGIKEIYQKYKERKIIIIGRGSNILLSKEYYDESYVFVNFKLMDKIEHKDNKITVETGATLASLSWYAVENNIKGFEFLEDVPGSVGGAIIMNAGTYEDTIGQLTEQVTYYNITENRIITDKVKKDNFGRRQSKWANNNIVIISCVFKAEKGDYIESLEKLLEIKKKRYLKQPRNYPNAGSVFKRPKLDGVDFYVWKLFDELDLRGYKRNGAMISDKHPGFIVNTGNAKPEDIIFLIDFAKEKVKSKFGINLELEWKVI